MNYFKILFCMGKIVKEHLLLSQRDLVPRELTATCNYSSRGSNVLFWPMKGTAIHMHISTHIHINKINFFMVYQSVQVLLTYLFYIPVYLGMSKTLPRQKRNGKSLRSPKLGNLELANRNWTLWLLVTFLFVLFVCLFVLRKRKNKKLVGDLGVVGR